MKPRQETNSNQTKDTAASGADAVSESLGVVGAALDATGGALPKPLAVVSDVAGAAAEALRHPGKNKAEQAVCGAAKALAQGAASGPLYAGAAAIGAATMPTPASAPYGAAAAVMAAGPAMNKTTQPVGDLADKACRAMFAWARGPEKAKTEQKHERINKTCGCD